MNTDEQLNDLIAAINHSICYAECLLRSYNFPIHARIKLFCLACMKNHQEISEIIYKNGNIERSDAAVVARNEILQYLMQLKNSQRDLDGYFTSVKTKKNSDGVIPEKRIFISKIFSKMRRVWLAADNGADINLYLLDRSFLLEQGFNANVRVCDESPLLHAALQMGDSAIVELLLNRGADPNMTNKSGSNALHEAAMSGAKGVVEMLVNHGADIHCVNASRRTPLHEFALRGFEREAELLLANGARVDSLDKYGNTALHEACRGGEPEITELLLRHGARVNAINGGGLTPLLRATKSMGLDDLTKDEGKKIERVIEVLVTNGADLTCVDPHDRTALHYLAGMRCERGVEYLLKNGAAVDSRDQEGWTPLHYAAGNGSRSGSPGAIELLLRHGAQIDAKDNEGMTPLVCATSCRNAVHCGFHNFQTPQKDVFDRLLNCGADPEACKISALQGATIEFQKKINKFCREGSERLHMVQKLLAHGAETGRLVAPIPSELRPARYLLEHLKTSLEYGLVRDLQVLDGIYTSELHDDRIDLPWWVHHAGIDIEERREAVATLIRTHVVKLQAAGLIQTPPGSDYSEKSVVLKALAEDSPTSLQYACEAEVDRMVAAIPGANWTYLEVLFMSVDQLTRGLWNFAMIEAFSGVEQDFPIYGTMLVGRLERGQVRRHWVEGACRICQALFDWQLREMRIWRRMPLDITERVVANFRDVELKRLVINHGRDLVYLRRWL